MAKTIKCEVYEGKACDGKFEGNCMLCVLVSIEKHLYKIMKALKIKDLNYTKPEK